MPELKQTFIRGEDELYSDDDLFNISSWGVDLSFREIITMYKEEELLKPELQRKYVWTQDEASRFIDSLLLGLPVPSIFLAKTEDETKLIVDGYQRIMTVYDFVENEIFSGTKKTFKLTNSNSINKRWRGKSFKELTKEEQIRIKSTSIHSIIFEQKKPNNDTGMYQIFERINTSGKTLKPQEIRNCVYHGKYNTFLMNLNKYDKWRLLLDETQEDSRMSDVEYILRFFALFNLKTAPEKNQKQISLKKYLNSYMSQNHNITEEKIHEQEQLFKDTMNTVYRLFGNIAFRNIGKTTDEDEEERYIPKFHPTIFDSIAIATASIIFNGKEPLEIISSKTKHLELLKDEDFVNAFSYRTTNVENIKNRITLASQYLYDTDYNF